MRRLLLFLLLPAWAPSSAFAAKRDDPWSDRIWEKREINADKELKKIMARIERGEIPKVQFDYDEDVVKAESFTALDLIADLMLKRSDLKLRITAHTCTMGTAEYNLDLSERRAKSVKEYLVKRGVPPPSIRYRGAGFNEPVADNSTEEGREKNRRVEFRITTRDWGTVY
jgi:outer membrane protein OmpA-like peptidoglycan-associated protein